MAQTTVANSTIAGFVTGPVVAAALTAILTIVGVTIPPIGIGGLVLTQTMDVGIVSYIISYLATHYAPDSVQQQIASLAKLAVELPIQTSHKETDFPNPPPQILTPSNLTNSAAAIAVIQAHSNLNKG